MSLSDVELGNVIAELGTELMGAHILKVRQPADATFILRAKRHDLLICARPQLARLHLSARGHAAVDTATEAADEAPAAATPTTLAPFALSLRATLRGAHLVRAAATPGDRIATLGFERGGEASELIAELTGQPNLILTQGGIIVAALHLPEGEQPRLVLGASYQPPTIGPGGARWLGRDRFGAGPGLSERIAFAYAALEDEHALVAARRQLDATLRRAHARAERLVGGLEKDRARAQTAEHYRKFGDLLLAHLGEIPRGASVVTLPDDFTDGSPIDIPLDPARAPRENASRYYTQHKKLAGSVTGIDRRIAEARAHLATLDALTAQVAAAQQLDQLTALAPGVEAAAPVTPTGPANARRERERRALPYHEFTSAAGDLIWVGKGAQANDQLTFRHARGADLWLHTRDVPGAHVVVRLGSGRTLDEQTLLDAATLAAHHSPARGASDVDVSYTHRKYVRKVSKQSPGLVSLASAKTLRIRLDPARLTRLLQTRRSS